MKCFVLTIKKKMITPFGISLFASRHCICKSDVMTLDQRSLYGEGQEVGTQEGKDGREPTFQGTTSQATEEQEEEQLFGKLLARYQGLMSEEGLIPGKKLRSHLGLPYELHLDRISPSS